MPLIDNGFWFTPIGRCCKAPSTLRRNVVTGTVKLKLYQAMSRWSPARALFCSTIATLVTVQEETSAMTTATPSVSFGSMRCGGATCAAKNN